MKRCRQKKILGLDVSSSCTGWALTVGGVWAPEAGFYGRIVPPKKFSFSQKLYYLCLELDSLIKELEPSHIVIEDVFHRFAKTTILLARIGGVAMEVCAANGIEPELMLATEARGIVGCGMSKESAFNWMTKKYGLEEWTPKKMGDVIDAAVLCLASFEKNF